MELLPITARMFDLESSCDVESHEYGKFTAKFKVEIVDCITQHTVNFTWRMPYSYCYHCKKPIYRQRVRVFPGGGRSRWMHNECYRAYKAECKARVLACSAKSEEV